MYISLEQQGKTKYSATGIVHDHINKDDHNDVSELSYE